jgi:internalin A
MRFHLSNLFLITALVLIALTASFTHSGERPNEQTSTTNEKAQWIAAGFRSGWLSADGDGALDFHQRPKAGDLQCFQTTSACKRESLKTLPAFTAPFGLLIDELFIRDDFLQGLPRFQQIRFLCLRAVGITDVGMREIGQLKELTHLEISESPNTELGEPEETKRFNQGLQYLAALAKLKVLNLSNSKCADSGINQLGEMKSLETINLQQTAITDLGLKKVATFKRLKTVNVLYASITQHGIKELAKLPDLQSLTIGGATDGELAEIGRISQLKALQIVSSKIDQSELKSLASLKNLRTLGWYTLPGGDVDLTKLSSLGQLQSLDLTGTAVTDIELKSICTLKQLKKLNLARTRITDAGLGSLTGLTELTVLDVRGSSVTAVGVERLKKTLLKATILFGHD